MSNRDIKLKFDTNKTYTVHDLASQNRLPLHSCRAALHELNASGDYDLIWGTDTEGIDTIMINKKGTEPKTKKHPRSKTREGKRMASVFFDKQVHDQLRMLTIETDKTLQDLQIEALNLLFTTYNKPPIAK